MDVVLPINKIIMIRQNQINLADGKECHQSLLLILNVLRNGFHPKLLLRIAKTPMIHLVGANVVQNLTILLYLPGEILTTLMFPQLKLSLTKVLHQKSRINLPYHHGLMNLVLKVFCSSSTSTSTSTKRTQSITK